MESQLDTVLQFLHATSNTCKKEWLEAQMASLCGYRAWPKQISPAELKKSSTVRLLKSLCLDTKNE